MLIVSGDADPLAQGGSAIEQLASRYRDTGVRGVEVHLHPGARHEVLNETNRDEVTADIVAFFDRTIGALRGTTALESPGAHEPKPVEQAGTHRRASRNRQRITCK